jgi:hypothetical protein
MFVSVCPVDDAARPEVGRAQAALLFIEAVKARFKVG